MEEVKKKFKIVDFSKENKDKIKKYGIPTILSLVSLPLAGAYLARKNTIPDIFISSVIGVLLTAGMGIGTHSFKRSDINEFEVGRVTVQQYKAFSSADSSTSFSTKSLLISIPVCFGTNYCIFETLRDEAIYDVTKISVEGKDGTDKVKCIYNFDGFKSLGEIDLNVKPNKISLNGRNVIGNLAVNSYGGLCTKIFNEDTMRNP